MPVASDSKPKTGSRKGRGRAASTVVGVAPPQAALAGPTFEPREATAPLSEKSFGHGVDAVGAIGAVGVVGADTSDLAPTAMAAAAAAVADAAASSMGLKTAELETAGPEAATPEWASAAAPVDATAAEPSSPAPPTASLTLSSKNYSSWSLRGWLLARFAKIEFTEVMVSPDDADARRELLLMAPSIRVPCLTHDGARVWNTLAIAQYLNEIEPDSKLMPRDRIARAHCRSISGEMNSGFANLRASLPMNLKARFPGHKIWAGAQPDIDRIVEIWTECLATYGGPFLFGEQRGMADAMFAPVVTRFMTYDVKLNRPCILYCETIMAMPEMQEWIAAAKLEPDDIDELEMDF